MKEAVGTVQSRGTLRSATLLVMVAALFLVGAVVLGRSVRSVPPLDAASIEPADPWSQVDASLLTDSEPRPAEVWGSIGWLYALYGVVVLGLIALLVRWLSAYLDRTRAELERQVAERTSEVQRQKRELETYNRELLRTNEQLRHVVEEKSRLLGVAAHDLKNPLFGIRALSEILLERSGLTPETERKLTLIHDSAGETLSLIDDLLQSAAQSSAAPAAFEPVDVAALTRWVVHSFEPHAERKNQALACTVASDGCVVEGDKRKLREAIGNLVSNALKYSPLGERIEVIVNRHDGIVQVDVTDAGPGLSASDQQRLFVPFQRLTPEPTGDESSSGLGLYIVKQVVDLHDGGVDVDSDLGEGSTFGLRLPAHSADGTPVPEVSPSNE